MSSEEIKVRIFKYPDRKNLVMGYDDPTTGKRVTRSAGTDDETKAIGNAAVWQDELNTGRYAAPVKLTWEEFTTRYKAEKVSSLAKGSRANIAVSLDQLTRVVNPDRLSKVTAAVVSQFQSKLRGEGMKETTIAHHLRNIRAALRWAAAMGLLPKAPKIEMPKIAKGQTLMKGRPITGEEFERMLDGGARRSPNDTELWRQFLNGLWLSGLRLDEACNLSWDEEEPFAVDLTGRRPVFRILAAAQKARRDELLPMTPDFAEWLLSTFPEAERVGKVFKLTTTRRRQIVVPTQVGKIISRIGESAKVVVNKTEEKFASAHDLRRAFGTRWAKRVSPAVLKRLMRHADISHDQKYYVHLDAADVADELWAKFGQGNISGNSDPKQALKGKGSNRRKSKPSKVNAGERT